MLPEGLPAKNNNFGTAKTNRILNLFYSKNDAHFDSKTSLVDQISKISNQILKGLIDLKHFFPEIFINLSESLKHHLYFPVFQYLQCFQFGPAIYFSKWS